LTVTDKQTVRKKTQY